MLSTISRTLRKEIGSASEEPKSYNSQSIGKKFIAIEVELSKGLTLPLTQINMKQPSKPPLKGFVPSTQEEEGGHEALVIDGKGFDPKAFKLLIKDGYNPKEKLSLGKLSSEATDKKLHGLNATQMMLKEKGYAVQDSRVGLGFTPPKPVRIAIKRVNNNYAMKELSSTEDDKRKEKPRESVFNRLGPHRRMVHETASKPSGFDRLDPCKREIHRKKNIFKVAARMKKNVKSSHTQNLRSLISSRMRRQTTLAISCGKVLKVKTQTMIFTQAQYDENDRESVASSNYISSSDNSYDGFNAFDEEQIMTKVGWSACYGAYKLIAEDGLRIGPINESFLKRYYAEKTKKK
ncbi:UNVERIFIED_CONTAM: hypothetical protein Slati_4261900 [Sesamum latifolium]|uniref:Uncharacterized protein n=1 Tax=Sesamum latifolium TaxID=2727402 RepID=A0AAW2TC48_9LAMI